MSAQDQFLKVEQDSQGPGDDLPTYDDLAAQSGPNSRFGRWKGWIEKRAAERYHDISPEELVRRRDPRRWDLEPEDTPEPPGSPAAQLPLHLRVHTDLPPLPAVAAEEPTPTSHTTPVLGQQLSPTRLRLNQFGSRFLPHATASIRCLLPLLNDKLLLIGHDGGLSVLDVFPQEWNKDGTISTKGPEDAQARVIWEGDAVHQMSILEHESTGEGTPQGVILALVGQEAERSKDQEPLRTLRMYNLASLISLAKWTVAQKGAAHPVDLHQAPHWDVQNTPTKKHRSQNSLTRGLRSLIESPISQSEPHSLSYQSLIPSNTRSSSRETPIRKDSTPDPTWHVIEEDLPLRWSTDYVSLATSGSRLLNSSVLSYALWRDGHTGGRGGALLAVATKSNILLYEKPKGERSFRFVKEFYTPLQPRNLSFIQQSVQDIKRCASVAGTSVSGYQALASTDTLQATRSTTTATSTVQYSTQLCIFVVFDKKAGIIRIADSAVGEVDLPNDPALNPDLPQMRDLLSPSTNSRRSRLSDIFVPSKSSWILPARVELPPDDQSPSSRAVYFLTRGKLTQVLSSPLPANLPNALPIFTVTWESPPSHVTPRVCHSSETGVAPFLQLVALGEDGVEVQEISLPFSNKGKGRVEELIRASADTLGDTGFLCNGGHWHQPGYPHQITRSCSAASNISGTSFESLEADEIISKMKMEQGIYGWCRKGQHDWRVFWVGGTGETSETENNGNDGL